MATVMAGLVELDTCPSSYVILRFFEPEIGEVRFRTMSGILIVTRQNSSGNDRRITDEILSMDFPAYDLKLTHVTGATIRVCCTGCAASTGTG